VGLTFVLVTHDPSVGDRCDRIVRFRDGLIVGQEDADAVIREAELVAAG
jgi:predicted ABC-type transport system involved in lysophospholipase L1 biosynthesis ATPase subunit